MFERALLCARALMNESPSDEQQAQVAEILHNLGTCWERLREHHTALKCYEEAQTIRDLLATPKVCVGAHIKPKALYWRSTLLHFPTVVLCGWRWQARFFELFDGNQKTKIYRFASKTLFSPNIWNNKEENVLRLDVTPSKNMMAVN